MRKFNKKHGRQRCLAFVVFILTAFVVSVGPAVAGEKPFSLEAEYSKEDQLQVAASYQLSERFAFELGHQSVSDWLDTKGWQGKLKVTPWSGMDFRLGYDFSGNRLLVGADAEFPFKENLKLVSALNWINATAVDQKYLDYQCGLEIGIGYDHTILAGAQGLYEFGKPHEPELFLALDLNWQLPKGYALSYNPTISVEGAFTQYLTVAKEWEDVKVAFFAGHEDDFAWNFGLTVSY